MRRLQQLIPLFRQNKAPISLAKCPQYGLQQVKNLFEETVKNEVQQHHDNKQLIEKYDRVYKPTYQIEFNRVGEVLLYSCDPFKHLTIYFKYPYIFYESLIPASIYMFLFNPFELAWYWNNCFAFLPFVLWTPRNWYFSSLSSKITRMYLLRGGKVVKIESQTLGADRNQTFTEIYQFHPLTQDLQNFDNRDEADFLEEEGSLKYELACQLDHYQDQGCNINDYVIHFMKEGTVHHPELFEAVCKGYHIDTSNFVINTAHNLRAREGNHSH